ncbi:MAG: hypothetical protein KBD76_08395 [Bacteriovorax sp.]|nr:hypothetical protein [Bacteriovorax sp.]
MKLKTSPLFSLNLFCKLFLLTGLAAFSIEASSQNQNPPGIIEGLERLIEVERKEYAENKSKSLSNLAALSNLTSLKDVNIDPLFVRTIILHSDDKFLRLIQNDECKFLAVLENNLFKTTDGEIESIPITFKNKENILERTSVPKSDFFEYIYKKKCLNNHEFSILFNNDNFQKTILGIKFSVPQNTNECENIHKEWIENSFTPYLCQIQQTIKKSKDKKRSDFYKEKIPAFQRTYIDNLCNQLSSTSFCENYLKNDIWSKVLNNEAPLYKLSFKCQNLLGKESVNHADLKNCAAKLVNEPSLCESKGHKDFSSNFPLQNCNVISDALNKSKLITNYHDCPGNVDNEALTNIHRIVNHFAPRKMVSNKETCAGEASYTFAQLNFDIKHEEGWSLKICFMDNVTQKEKCIPYIPGTRPEEPLSEDQVIAKILYQQKGASPKTKCRIVDSKTYNPIRSDFKSGCFIVYDAENCTSLNCTKKVIWDEKKQEDITFIGKSTFDYFPNAYINERYSFSSMINEVKGTEQRSIKNLTDLKFYLDKMPNGIIHGVGCIEDLIPEEFYRTTINQCHPMPFIIDGHTLKNNETWIVLRSSIDDLHSPRLILWHNIFNAVSAHQEMHPLNSWTLYGIKK